jgi:hypothetical protein
MKKLLLAAVLGAFILLAGCKKEAAPAPSGPDYTTNWVGIYNGPQWGSPSQILVTKASNNSVHVQIKMTQDSYQYSAVTLQDVTINGANATVNETQNIIEFTNLGPYKFLGTISLSGNQVNMNVTAASTDPSNENSPQNFAFVGSKAN